MLKKLKRIVYQVPDVEKARDWYSNLLNQEPAFDSLLAAIFKVGECTMTLAKGPIVESKDAGQLDVYWEVDDVDQCFERLLEMGASQRSAPKNTLTIRTAQVIDPFGNILGLSGGIRADRGQAIENQPSETAHAVALCRVLASRDRRLGDRAYDPYSELFLKENVRSVLHDEAACGSIIDKMISRPLYGYFIARSAFLDDAFVRAIKSRMPQIVVLGAGYDTRAFRFQDIVCATRIFEVDAMSTQNRKKELLASTGTPIPPQVTFVGMNFNADHLGEKLRAAGFDRSQASLFVWEGVTYYLSQETMNQTLGLLRDNSAPGSGLCFDYAVRKLDSISVGEPFLSWLDPAAVQNYLKQYGFRLVEHMDAAQMRARYLMLEAGAAAEKPLSALRLVYAERMPADGEQKA